jgi:hypothetical protein
VVQPVRRGGQPRLRASAIYAVSRDFNLMLETVAGWNEDIAEGAFAFEETVERSTTAIISPGARYAFNLPNEAQLVIGAALPIALTSDSRDFSSTFHSSIPSYELNLAAANSNASISVPGECLSTTSAVSERRRIDLVISANYL